MVQIFHKSPHVLLLFSFALAISFACRVMGGGAPAVKVDSTPKVMEVDIELGPGNFDFPDPTAGLDLLTSFKATLTVAFEGSDGGQASQWSTTSILTYQKEPSARLLTLETTAESEPPEPQFRAEMNGAEYEQHVDGRCFARPLDPANSIVEFLNPVVALVGVFGAETAGQDTVNGMPTDHYTFDERALGQAELNKSSGELWIASEGGYLVRYLLTTEGDEKYFGEDTAGTITRNYEISEVNQVAPIQLPAGCPGGMIDAPLLTSASNVTNMPGLLKYETTSSIADVVAFYEQELPGRGWTLPSSDAGQVPEGVSAEEYQRMLEQMEALGMSLPIQPNQPSQPTLDADAEQAVLSYERGESDLKILVNKGETATHVVLTLRNPTE